MRFYDFKYCTKLFPTSKNMFKVISRNTKTILNLLKLKVRKSIYQWRCFIFFTVNFNSILDQSFTHLEARQLISMEIY